MSLGNWYKSEKHLGGTAANEAIILTLIRQKDFAELGKLVEENAELPSLEMYFRGCEVCDQGSSRLSVRRATQDAKGALRFTEVLSTVLTPGEGSRLLKGVQPVVT